MGAAGGVEDPKPNRRAVGKDSTHALGVVRPDESGDKKVLKDVVVPLGALKTFNDKNYMGANEYIVYNTNQIKMHYIVRIKQ